MTLAISNPDFAKFLSIKEQASLRCADTACKEIELIPRHTLAISKAISNPDFAKSLSIKERASLRCANTAFKKICANTAFKKIKLIPRHTIQELYENNHKTLTARHPTYSANSVTLCNMIADQTCLDIIKMTKSEGFALSDRDLQRALRDWIYPLIRSIAVIAPPDR